MTTLQITPDMVLKERELMRLQGGLLAHTYNTEGYAKTQENCDCHTCGDAFDPTGEKTAARLNAPPPPMQGGLQPAASIHPEHFSNPLRALSTPTTQVNPLHIPPMPGSPPRLERQRPVYYDENGVDILGMGQKPRSEQSQYSRECDLISSVILESKALLDHNREELNSLLCLSTFTHEQAIRLARLHARSQVLKSVISHFDLRNL